jgi:hypothetical protein
MRLRVNKRHVLLATAVALAPFAAGCGPDVMQFAADKNGRAAYIVNNDPAGNGDFRDAVTASGVTSVMATANGATFSYAPESSDLAALSNLQQVSPTRYQNANGDFAEVNQVLAGIVPDAFLVFTQNNPADTHTTQYTYGYSGTRAPQTFVDTLTNNKHKATYTGGSDFRGAIGNQYMMMSGTLTMDVEFGDGKNEVQGSIGTLVGTPPVPMDQVKFEGSLSHTNSDFEITSVEMLNGTTVINATGNSGGVGSFFGDRAQGTIGVFHVDGMMADGTTRVNALGQFHGSTTDNN